MLCTTRRLGGILPALAGSSAGAAAACDAVLSRPLALEGNRRHSTAPRSQNAEPEPVEESWWREVQGAAHSGGGGAEQHPQQRSRHSRYSSIRLEAPIDAPRTLRDYQKMVLALSRRRRCGAVPCCDPAAGCPWRVAGGQGEAEGRVYSSASSRDCLSSSRHFLVAVACPHGLPWLQGVPDS
jgi:hypothetical protein